MVAWAHPLKQCIITDCRLGIGRTNALDHVVHMHTRHVAHVGEFFCKLPGTSRRVRIYKYQDYDANY